MHKRKHVGPYAVGRTLGEGAFGKVKLGTNIFTNEKVAIKIVGYKNVKSERERQQLERERNVLMRLKHPNIVNLLKVVEDRKRNKCYMIFEYVNGGELFDFIVNHGRLPEKDARRLMRSIISAVEYCHSFLIIHRDLKPENLLLDEDFNVKITDFGLSNIMEPGKKFQTFCGSLHYACPEILTGQAYLGPGVDIWSMGIILYCLVVGRQPWDGNNADELMKAILEEGLEIPEDCVHFILSMLRVKEHDRISGAEMRYHPWVMEGYGTPPESYLPPVVPLPFLDEEILDQMRQMGFITPENEDEVRSGLTNGNGENRFFCIYNILVEQRAEKVAAEQKQKAEKREFNLPGRNRSYSASYPNFSSGFPEIAAMPVAGSAVDQGPFPEAHPIKLMTVSEPALTDQRHKHRRKTKIVGAEDASTMKHKKDKTAEPPLPSVPESRIRSETPKKVRPVMSLEDIATGKIKRPNASPSPKKPRKPQAEKPNIFDIFPMDDDLSKQNREEDIEHSPDIIETTHNRDFEDDDAASNSSSDEYEKRRHRMNRRRQRPATTITASSVPNTLTPMVTASLPESATSAFLPQLVTSLPVMKVISELENILESLNCRYKIKPKLLLKCKYEIEGEPVSFFVEIVHLTFGGDLRRGIKIRRLGGNGFVYTSLYEKLVLELKPFCQENKTKI